MKNVYYIDIGKMSKEDAENYIRKMMGKPKINSCLSKIMNLVERLFYMMAWC